MDLQGVTLGRRCQPRKILCCVTVFMKHPQNDNRGEEQQTESSNGHAGLTGHESLACKDKAVLHFDCGSGCRNLFSVITTHWMVYTERYVRSEKHHVLALHYYYMSIGARKQGMGLSKLFWHYFWHSISPNAQFLYLKISEWEWPNKWTVTISTKVIWGRQSVQLLSQLWGPCNPTLKCLGWLQVLSSCFLLMRTLGGSRWWLMYLNPCHSHERLWVLTFACPDPRHQLLDVVSFSLPPSNY